MCCVQKKDAPLFTCQEEAGGDASFGLVSRVSIALSFSTVSFISLNQIKSSLF